MLIQEFKHKYHIKNSKEYSFKGSLDRVKMDRTITSRRRLESRICKFRIYIKFRLALIAQTYTHKSLILVFKNKSFSFRFNPFRFNQIIFLGFISRLYQKQVYNVLYMYWILSIHIGPSNEFEKTYFCIYISFGKKSIQSLDFGKIMFNTLYIPRLYFIFQ